MRRQTTGASGRHASHGLRRVAAYAAYYAALWLVACGAIAFLLYARERQCILFYGPWLECPYHNWQAELWIGVLPLAIVVLGAACLLIARFFAKIARSQSRASQ